MWYLHIYPIINILLPIQTGEGILTHCENSTQPTFVANCSDVGVMFVKQAYIGTGNDCSPSSDRTLCVPLTEHLRVKCNRQSTCYWSPDLQVVGCERAEGSAVYIEYQCMEGNDMLYALNIRAQGVKQTANTYLFALLHIILNALRRQRIR